MPVTTRRATLDDLDALAPLFADYRTFYSMTPDLDTARRFLHERLSRGESVVFLAELDGRPAGFTQLYPMFSSVRAQRTFILPSASRSRATKQCRESNAFPDTATAMIRA